MKIIHALMTTVLLCTLCLLAAACQSSSDHAPGDASTLDPSQKEIPLPAAEGWEAFLLIDIGDKGIWTVKALQVFEQYAAPEVVGLDDEGRCIILVSYSGKWSPRYVIHEMKWLGGLAHGDVDPRIPGSELYTGGQRGNLYQVTAYPHGALDFRLIAHFPGKEIHTLLSGDLDPMSAGAEVLVFTRPGGLYRVAPTGDNGTFDVKLIQELPGRVRDALVLPTYDGGAAQIATVSRAGTLDLLQLTAKGPTWKSVHEIAMGRGRLALKPRSAKEPVVLYSTADDGRIFRHECRSSGEWETEAIFLGPQGPRGIAPGQFHKDLGLESIAVFGYSGEVTLLTRQGEGAWKQEVLFEDRDKGHWLAAAELDGRNATMEIIGSGYGGRIFMLARPPGYGLEGTAADE